MSRMHVAVRSGFVVEDGDLVEITRGRTRVAPEVLERDGYAEFFDATVTAKGTDSTRTICRGVGPDGRMFAIDDPRDLPRRR
jgi:hypothetical protein